MSAITEFLTTFSSWAVSVSAIIAALAAICKPLRKLIGKIFQHMRTNHSVEEKIDAMEERLIKKIDEVSGKCDAVSKKCDDNEKDRLKDVIFKYGNYARKGQHISSEDFRYLQVEFTKYTGLGGNDIAHDEYNFIVDYYNRQPRGGNYYG